MSATAQRIADIEAEMARTQKNKATMAHLCSLKAQLAQLKRTEIENQMKGQGGGGDGWDVKATGDSRVGLIGFPSVGKSTLLTKLTGTHSESAAYEFTTLTCIPGIIRYKGAKIQLLDLPGIIEGAKDGKGRGKRVIGTARTCSLILIVLDASKPVTYKKLIEKELHGFGIRLNQKKPNVYFKRHDKGGIQLHVQLPSAPTHINPQVLKSILNEYKIHHAEITLREDCTVDELIDIVESTDKIGMMRVYIPAVYVCNMIDKISIEELDIIDRIPHYVPISAKDEWNFDGMLETMWDHMDLLRIYTKPKGQIPDYNEPVVMPREKLGAASVELFCNRIHKGLMKQFKYALVWGASAKHTPQRCGKDHVLEDEDVIQIVKKVG
mmetsp:Transcript_22167/g.55907  ORF Transcript_22167/g.55907 Transcript_22167/m.55907 type:complete len:381 (-) Transcript_22167:102-1244(-)|eukprot:CAMPEP_0174940184 /NCGR_PEP_ID=MMETSP1355-20121228/68435_1 /TAXON_ID=464990 /ORGANISM="Hemiselmis tepida, Strain CCMP443" /LENGTH=380 /DNA_ID=CAMNT_0016187231 /DNA_START=46 /DNA_END=1188 /DNA_ORIENTATION=+